MAHILYLKYLQLELERIIGLTTATPSGLTCNGVNEELAYVAGCVVVIYNVKTNCQTHFLMARGNPKPFSCVAFSSQGGKYIAAGEVPSSVPDMKYLVSSSAYTLVASQPSQ